MKKNRRDFLKMGGMAGISMASAGFIDSHTTESGFINHSAINDLNISKNQPTQLNEQINTGQSMDWTNWPLFTVGIMVQKGYSDNDILKILGGNAIGVARAAVA